MHENGSPRIKCSLRQGPSLLGKRIVVVLSLEKDMVSMRSVLEKIKVKMKSIIKLSACDENARMKPQ